MTNETCQTCDGYGFLDESGNGVLRWGADRECPECNSGDEGGSL